VKSWRCSGGAVTGAWHWEQASEAARSTKPLVPGAGLRQEP
jgi:hypothetical protein